ncbi:MAG: hypothetical protein ABFD92_13665 [Planctomycetaceae bacterium]|nr:hypothetical protein [Planctomycetaceae bacterium]
MTWRRLQEYLESQRRMHGKTVFTATELANAAGCSLPVLRTTVTRLVKDGRMVRYAAGRYGLGADVTVDALLATLDSNAYITGLYALHRYGLVTQAVREITCFTTRRHNRSRVRTTPLGRLVFVCVNRALYTPPAAGVVAPPEQALCDFVCLTLRQGLLPQTLVTLRNLETLDAAILQRVCQRYPLSVQRWLKKTLPSRHTGPSRFER